MNYAILKQALIVVASASGGFYVGGRYVGGLAQTTYFGSKPAWIAQAQQTMYLALALTAIAAVAWIALDMRTTEDTNA